MSSLPPIQKPRHNGNMTGTLDSTSQKATNKGCDQGTQARLKGKAGIDSDTIDHPCLDPQRSLTRAGRLISKPSTPTHTHTPLHHIRRHHILSLSLFSTRYVRLCVSLSSRTHADHHSHLAHALRGPARYSTPLRHPSLAYQRVRTPVCGGSLARRLGLAVPLSTMSTMSRRPSTFQSGLVPGAAARLLQVLRFLGRAITCRPTLVSDAFLAPSPVLR
ncbi:uncharacterized protein BDZ83DRAFT_176318 [Colletotrichum acutatum]|uniref:Uncharacterized protein n=1 Tax=Glomerella acutata TaxID=27357 RepID=A0AAD8UAK6_GLOAC|nr:uncharacterized protein BDZ83DRAFT_176318 [Colletotrichum acutatum]KAK1707519.1 hypothetical protein BDZ83DRAFT_176318 [Colletotrichum acutatum]